MKSRSHTKKGPGRMPFNRGNPKQDEDSRMRDIERQRAWTRHIAGTLTGRAFTMGVS